jgi:hypothetical protein
MFPYPKSISFLTLSTTEPVSAPVEGSHKRMDPLARILEEELSIVDAEHSHCGHGLNREEVLDHEHANLLHHLSSNNNGDEEESVHHTINEHQLKASILQRVQSEARLRRMENKDQAQPTGKPNHKSHPCGWLR